MPLASAGLRHDFAEPDLDLLADLARYAAILVRSGPNSSTTSGATRLSNIFTKLQVSERSRAIVKAREAGLGGA